MNLFLQPEGCMTIRLINLSKLAAPALLSPHHRVILPGTSLSAVFVSRTDCDSLSRYRIEEAILRARRASNLMHLSACITVDTVRSRPSRLLPSVTTQQRHAPVPVSQKADLCPMIVHTFQSNYAYPCRRYGDMRSFNPPPPRRRQKFWEIYQEYSCLMTVESY